ncbi:MAG: TIM barrel protein [Chloroflexi bacterium]|nr:TIM barrel protein [Chloroflexota bacterium]MCY3936788.1 TIM barrel protein [Chloroflexota bacterium]
MDRPWHSHFDLGVILGMMFPETGDGDGPVLERAKQIFEDEFFTILELTRIKDPKVRQELRAMADVSDTKLGFRAQVPILNTGQNLAALEEDKRRAGVENVKESLDEALELGCVAFSLMDGRDSYPGEDKKYEAIDALEQSLHEICAHARASANGGEPIPISLEQFDQVVDKKSVIGKTDDAVALTARIRDDYPSFGLLVDQGHLPLLYVQPDEVFRALGDMTFHVDVGNCVRRPGRANFGDTHPRWDFPGGVNGVAETREFLRAMANTGFFDRHSPTPRPIVSFEIKPFEGEDPDMVLAGSKRIFQEAWATL